jgi:alkylresorcinol/alkylpyrone synthase
MIALRPATARILATHTMLPPIRHSAADVEQAFMQWLSGQDRDLRVRAQRILRNGGVDGRHSFLPLHDIFAPRSLESAMALYRQHAVELGTRALAEGLAKAGVAPDEVDILITTSCTGYMIPSADAYMSERLGMRSDLLRVPITEMGCAAGASALMYAAQMLRGTDDAVAAIVNIEFPTNTMRIADFTLENIVATALFSDGIGCTVLRSGEGPARATIRDWRTHQVERTTHILGYELTDAGFRMNLDESLPDVIASHFGRATYALLAPHGLALSDIEHFVIHPGGVRILDRLQELLAPHGGSVERSRAVMRRFGNMSSSTVTFILDELLSTAPGATPAQGTALLASFGPGFGAHQLLLDVHAPAARPARAAATTGATAARTTVEAIR